MSVERPDWATQPEEEYVERTDEHLDGAHARGEGRI